MCQIPLDAAIERCLNEKFVWRIPVWIPIFMDSRAKLHTIAVPNYEF